jgi:hypothetical protein
LEQYDAVKAQYFSIEDKAARQEFVTERKRIVAGIIEVGNLLRHQLRVLTIPPPKARKNL